SDCGRAAGAGRRWLGMAAAAAAHTGGVCGACGMKRYVVLLLLGLWLGPGAALARAESDALVIAAGQHVPGNIATVAQDIRIDGTVAGDVTSWSGAITIAGSVGGDVGSYGGDLTRPAPRPGTPPLLSPH